MFCCGSSWGIGVYKTMYGKDVMELYGFPPKDMNPNDFSPDWECCTKEELEAWEEAKKNWRPNGK